MARKLAVVGPDTAPPRARRPVKPKTIVQAAEASERDLLVALRTHLSAEMDKGAVPAHALANVSAKIREYDRDIRALDARSKADREEAERAGDVEDEDFDAEAL